MEHPSPHEAVEGDNIEALESLLRECYGRVAYSHKTHEKCADICSKKLRNIKLVQIILSAITTGGLIIAILGESKFSAVFAAITSTTLLAINTYTKEYDLGELAQKYSDAAGDLWNMRESYLSLLVDIRNPKIDTSIIRTKRDQLQEALKNIYQAAPRTIPKGYSEAQKALKVNEELTFSDQEIDEMLPPLLRKFRR